MLRRFGLLGFGSLLIACSPAPSNSGGTGGVVGTGGAAQASGGAGPSSGGSSSGGIVGSGGSTSGGSANGGSISGGASTGGVANTGGNVTGGAAGAGAAGAASGGGSAGGGLGGSSGAAGGGAGGTGGGGGSSTVGWTCPSGVTGKPTLTGAIPSRVTSVPPPDAFNMNNGTFGNIEGPVWVGDALYVSEMNNTPYNDTQRNVVQSRILKVTSDGNTSIFVPDSGSNGMAVDSMGNLVAAVHKDGSLTRFALPGGAPTTVVDLYMGKRFNTPNDLAIRSDGNIYFSDPNFQAPNPLPQGETRLYRRDPSGNVTAIGMFNNPNGVTLSLKEDFLYLAASNGKKFPVMADGSLGTAEDFAPSNGADGMTIDCAGNLYVAKGNNGDVGVYAPDGSTIGTISVPSSENIQTTNVAFGGSDHKTLYITGLQNKKGLFQVKLDIPGRPY